MADTGVLDKEDHDESYIAQTQDIDPTETAEWLDSLKFVISKKGPERAKYLLTMLEQTAQFTTVETLQAI